jgi:monovalent cation:proton antiporter-2 (CPA2) family protein
MDQNSFLFQALVYLAAAVIMVPLAKRIGLGSVLGYLIAGMIIGPAILGIVGQEGQDVMHFAELGVVLMLFVIGLELEPELLWKLRKSILGMGGLQVLSGTIILGTLASFFGLNWKESLALGMILSLSSTAIVLQTLNEKDLMKSSAGQSSFSVLLFQDIAVIPMLALFPLLASNPDTESGHTADTLVSGLPGWLQTLVVLGSVGAIIIAGRFLVRPFFRIIAATRLREVFTAAVLLLVVGITVLMTEVGLSPALGTFLAGVVLANSEYRHELESDIDPFKGLLLGLFFISVGASIDFSLVIEQPFLILGLVLLVMFVKALLLALIGKVFRLKIDQNLLFSFALSQVGEFAFVLFSFSIDDGILTRTTVDTMVAVVALSMAFTPLILLFYEKWLQPRVGCAVSEPEREPDLIDEHNPVIIAGFGHFGSTIGRFLKAHKIGATILDNNPERVEVLRKMGFKVYYGDATRHDLLEIAGAGKARLIIMALEPAERRLELIGTIKKHFPNLRMLVRAENRFDAYDQMNAGMLHVYRETVDTALRVGVDAMKFLGYRQYTALRAARTFLKVDEANLKKLASIQDPDEYLLTAKAKMEELEQTLVTDNHQFLFIEERGWDEESLIADANRPAEKT